MIVRHLTDTRNKSLVLDVAGKVEHIKAFADADFTHDDIDHASTTGFMIHFLGGTVIWRWKLQQTITLSSTKAECTALAKVCRE